jgi:hypothetical protein
MDRLGRAGALVALASALAAKRVLNVILRLFSGTAASLPATVEGEP